jgi:hypothetical protein
VCERCTADVPLRERDGVAVQSDDAEGPDIGGVGCVPIQQPSAVTESITPSWVARASALAISTSVSSLVITGRSPSYRMRDSSVPSD